MRILVCGGAGYVGSHAVRKLRGAGHEVVVVDSLERGHLPAVGDAPFIKADIADRRAIKQALTDYGIDSVMHFAARCLVGESMAVPDVYYRQNVVGTLILLEAMLEAGVGRIVFSSTAAVYGEPVEIPITESHPTDPVNPYGATKLAAEGALRWFGRAYGLKYIALRYFNAAGADPAGDIGEDHRPETHLIPRILTAALGLQPGVEVLGADYPTPDGTCIRDYVHVCDLAGAHLLALERLAGGGESAVYNLGGGRGFSVREVIGAAEKVTGMPARTAEGARRAGDPAVLVASADKAARDLGWKTEYSDLNSIISSAWNWHRKNPGGYPA